MAAANFLDRFPAETLGQPQIEEHRIEAALIQHRQAGAEPLGMF